MEQQKKIFKEETKEAEAARNKQMYNLQVKLA